MLIHALEFPYNPSSSGVDKSSCELVFKFAWSPWF